MGLEKWTKDRRILANFIANWRLLSFFATLWRLYATIFIESLSLIVFVSQGVRTMKNKMLKLLAVILTLLLAFSLAACGTKSQPAEPEKDIEETEELEETEEVQGEEEQAFSRDLDAGWTIADNSAAALPEEVQTAFDKATEGFVGSDLVPVAYFGTQVVSGNNYAILCKATTVTREPLTTLKVAIIYADTQGNAEMIYLNDFWLVDYTGGEDGEIQTYEEDLAGGWAIPDNYTQQDLPGEVKDAFGRAADELLGNDLVPMAYLGTQASEGTNYAVLCHSTLTTADPVKSIQVVTVYKDTDGTAFITNIATVNAADFNKEADQD